MRLGKLKVKRRRKKGGVKIQWKRNRFLTLADLATKSTASGAER